MQLRIGFLLLMSTGCARERPPAPTEMVDLVRYMFANWEDEIAMGDALDNLQPWLQDNAHTEEAEDGFRLLPLISSDVSGVDRPDRSLANLLGAAGGSVSAFGLKDHAEHMVLTDQQWANPTQYKSYIRALVEGDRDTFTSGSGHIRTVNQVETSNWGVSIPYELYKDYRWVEGETSRGIIARTWVMTPSCNEGGGNCVEQSFGVDLWAADGGDCMRWTASWTEVTSSIRLGDDTLIAGLALGIQNIFRATETFLEEQ